MPAYLVRTIESSRLVGFFVARDPSQLFGVVDEVLNPLTCEYFKMNNEEGIFVDGQFTAEQPEDVDGGDANDFCVYLRPSPGEEPTPPDLSERLSARLDAGRSWTAFSNKNMIEAFGLPSIAVSAAQGAVL